MRFVLASLGSIWIGVATACKDEASPSSQAPGVTYPGRGGERDEPEACLRENLVPVLREQQKRRDCGWWPRDTLPNEKTAAKETYRYCFQCGFPKRSFGCVTKAAVKETREACAEAAAKRDDAM